MLGSDKYLMQEEEESEQTEVEEFKEKKGLGTEIINQNKKMISNLASFISDKTQSSITKLHKALTIQEELKEEEVIVQEKEKEFKQLVQATIRNKEEKIMDKKKKQKKASKEEEMEKQYIELRKSIISFDPFTS